MPHKDTPSDPTSNELELLRKLRANPILASNIDLVMERFEQELANGSDAHQAEQSVIEMLQNLGQNMMTQWAEHSCQNSEASSLEQDRSIQKHAKKNSHGKPPLDPSS